MGFHQRELQRERRYQTRLGTPRRLRLTPDTKETTSTKRVTDPPPRSAERSSTGSSKVLQGALAIGGHYRITLRLTWLERFRETCRLTAPGAKCRPGISASAKKRDRRGGPAKRVLAIRSSFLERLIEEHSGGAPYNGRNRSDHQSLHTREEDKIRCLVAVNYNADNHPAAGLSGIARNVESRRHQGRPPVRSICCHGDATRGDRTRAANG